MKINGSIELTKEQAANLLEMFNGDEATITVTGKDGELVAYHTDYPEEGSLEL
jgi:hypothetical protein